MQKMVEFQRNEGIDMLKFGCTLPILAKICLHKSTTAKFYPFTESVKDLLCEIREHKFGGLCVVFSRKVVMDETFIWDSTNWCKIIAGIDGSQLYFFSMCPARPTALYTRLKIYPESGNFKPRLNKTRSFENMVMSNFEQVRPQCQVESFYTAVYQKKIDAYSVDGFCGHCNTVFEAIGFYYPYRPCQVACPFLTSISPVEEELQRSNKKRELDKLRKHYVQETCCNVIEMYEC